MYRFFLPQLFVFFAVLLWVSPAAHATGIQLLDGAAPADFSLPRRSSSQLSSAALSAGSNSSCTVQTGGWVVDYGSLLTVVQQYDHASCTLLAVQVVASSNSSDPPSMRVLGIAVHTGAVAWSINTQESASSHFGQYGTVQQLWLDAINQRLYVSGWTATLKQQCGWVHAYQYNTEAGSAVDLLWKGVQCRPADQWVPLQHTGYLVLWPWADSTAGGAPIALLVGAGIDDFTYGLQLANASMTLFDGATGRVLQHPDVPLDGRAITVAACTELTEQSDVQRIAFYHDQYWSWQGWIALFDVHRNGSMQQVGDTLHWQETDPVWRAKQTDASCVFVREGGPSGPYDVFDVPSGNHLWTKGSNPLSSIPHPLNSSLLVVADATYMGGQLLWSVSYKEVRTGAVTAQTPTLAFEWKNSTGVNYAAPNFYFDLPGVLYTEYYMQFDHAPANHTWHAFDVMTLELISSGTTVSDAVEFGYRPLSLDANRIITALWQDNTTEPSTWTVKQLSSTRGDLLNSSLRRRTVRRSQAMEQ